MHEKCIQCISYRFMLADTQKPGQAAMPCNALLGRLIRPSGSAGPVCVPSHPSACLPEAWWIQSTLDSPRQHQPLRPANAGGRSEAASAGVPGRQFWGPPQRTSSYRLWDSWHAAPPLQSTLSIYTNKWLLFHSPTTEGCKKLYYFSYIPCM